MGLGWSLFSSTDDPWKASAFFFAFMQLILALLVLAHTIIACITSQLMRFYGWDYPSNPDRIRHQGATGKLRSGFLKNRLNLEINVCRNPATINPHQFFKRTCNEDTPAISSSALVCPKCHEVRNASQCASEQSTERATLVDADGSSVGNSSYAGASKTSYASSSSMGCTGDQSSDSQKSYFTSSASSQKLKKSKSLGARYVHSGEDGHKALKINTSHENCKLTGETEPFLNSPLHYTSRFVTKVVAEADIHRDKLEEGTGSSSKGPIENGSRRVSHRSAHLHDNLHRPESRQIAQEDIPKGIIDENLAAAPKKEDNEENCSTSLVINGVHNEKIHTSKDDSKDFTLESVIKGLREALLKEKEKFCNLYVELETERISSETAANEAMAMISRLQEEKSSLQMQAANYRRIAEERVMYDEQAMQLLKDILLKKEKENFLLEKEVHALQSKCSINARICDKRRKIKDRRSSLSDRQELDMLYKDEGADESPSPGVKLTKIMDEPLPPLLSNEKQPSKGSKSSMDLASPSTPCVSHESKACLSSEAAPSAGRNAWNDSFPVTINAEDQEEIGNGLITEDITRVSGSNHGGS